MRACREVALAQDARLTGDTVIPLVHLAALQRVTLVLPRIIVDGAAFGCGQGVARFPAACGCTLVGLAAVAHRHIVTVSRLRLG